MSKFKVYKYGLLRPTVNGDLVADQMHKAHKYQNTLIEIERGRRDAVRSFTRFSSKAISALETQLKASTDAEIAISKEIKSQHATMRSRVSTKTDKDDLKKQREETKSIKSQLREARVSFREDKSIQERLQEISDLANELNRSARKYSQVYWGTYLLVDKAIEATSKMPLYIGSQDNNPKFIRWSKSGRIGVQIQGGLESKKIFGSNSRIKIDPLDEQLINCLKRSDRVKGMRTTLHIRVESDSKKNPVWASFPMIMHRPLPEGSVIKEVAVHKRVTGSKEEWSVDFLVNMDNVKESPSVGEGMVAFDLGWRDLKDKEGNSTGFRMGKFRDDQDNLEELTLPVSLLERFKKVEDLKSIRANSFNEIKDNLSNWLSNNTPPEWLKKRCSHLSQWHSKDRLYNLIQYWASNRFDGDEDIFGVSGKYENKQVVPGTGLLGWKYHDFHLEAWETNMRVKTLRARREFYRVSASKLAKKYKTLIIEDFNLSNVSRRADVLDVDDNQNARSNKTKASPSELIMWLNNAFSGNICLVDPKGTSYTCHLCDSKENLDSATHIHTCSNCGETWDREDNATANILKLGRESLSVEQTTNGACNSEKSNDNPEIKESVYERRTRLKKEKKERLTPVCKMQDKSAESFIP